MREIEFRIKDCKGKWHYGYPVFFDDGSFEFFVNEKLKELLPYEECSVECAFNNTLGQYTGLCDKNGTKIFEGDILKYLYSSVECGGSYEMLEVFYEDGQYWAGYRELLEVLSVAEVIGNIHDDRELLEE